jgi:flagellar protein FlaI
MWTLRKKAPLKTFSRKVRGETMAGGNGENGKHYLSRNSIPIVPPVRDDDKFLSSRIGSGGPVTDFDPQEPSQKFDDEGGERYELLDSYVITEGYSSVRILKDRITLGLLYSLIEPDLSNEDSEFLGQLKKSLTTVLRYPLRSSELSDRKQLLREAIIDFASTRFANVDQGTLRKVEYYVFRDFFGYGVVDQIIRDENVEDISCNGVGIPVFVYHKKYENIRTNIVFRTSQELNAYIVRLSQKGRRQISVADPILNASTPEGHRLNATLGNEVTTRGGSFTIRVFGKKPFTPVDLIINGTISPEATAYLWLSVELGKNTIVIGGTGAGKTSTLNAVSIFIPSNDKIVSIEDTREIKLPHSNWIASVIRSGIGESQYATGKPTGEIDMFDLLRSALRQRPDVLIVGEVRGKESYNLFQAMSTGQVTLATMHADSINSMISRLENQPIGIPRIMMTSLNNVITQAQVKVKGRTVRRVTDITEVTGYDDVTDAITTNRVFTWNKETDRIEFVGRPNLFTDASYISNLSHKDLATDFEMRTVLMRYLALNNVRDSGSIWNYIAKYREDPIALYNKIISEMQGST